MNEDAISLVSNSETFKKGKTAMNVHMKARPKRRNQTYFVKRENKGLTTKCSPYSLSVLFFIVKTKLSSFFLKSYERKRNYIFLIKKEKKGEKKKILEREAEFTILFNIC